MKKIILVFLTAAFVFALSSCEQSMQKKQNKDMQKERSERRW